MGSSWGAISFCCSAFCPDAVDPTLLVFSINLQHALDAMLLTLSSDLQDAVHVTHVIFRRAQTRHPFSNCIAVNFAAGKRGNTSTVRSLCKHTPRSHICNIKSKNANLMSDN